MFISPSMLPFDGPARAKGLSRGVRAPGLAGAQKLINEVVVPYVVNDCRTCVTWARRNRCLQYGGRRRRHSCSCVTRWARCTGICVRVKAASQARAVIQVSSRAWHKAKVTLCIAGMVSLLFGAGCEGTSHPPTTADSGGSWRFRAGHTFTAVCSSPPRLEHPLRWLHGLVEAVGRFNAV